ncbi:MAG: hypothetical protein RBT70_06165 [Alphaproteobacteria bacterium]|nr:hypothetical protein [Alphaproteobacteria bacterium]
MEKFETYMMRHGEHGTQAFLEMWERFNGVRHTSPLPLEKRWEIFINRTNSLPPIAA